MSPPNWINNWLSGDDITQMFSMADDNLLTSLAVRNGLHTGEQLRCVALTALAKMYCCSYRSDLRRDEILQRNERGGPSGTITRNARAQNGSLPKKGS
jgi:hypothetical protein